MSDAAIPATVDGFLNCTGVYREEDDHDDVFCMSCIDVGDVVAAADVDGSDSGCLRPRGALRNPPTLNDTTPRKTKRFPLLPSLQPCSIFPLDQSNPSGKEQIRGRIRRGNSAARSDIC